MGVQLLTINCSLLTGFKFGGKAGGRDTKAAASGGPAHVGEGDEVGGGEAWQGGGFDTEEGSVAAKTHGADAEAVGVGEEVAFEVGEAGVGGGVGEGTEELAFGVEVAVGAVAANAEAEDAGGATLALNFAEGVEDAGADAGKVAAGVEGLVREGVLAGGVFGAAAFLKEPNFGVGAGAGFEVAGGGFGGDVVVDGGAGEGVDGVFAQEAGNGGAADGVLGCGLEKVEVGRVAGGEGEEEGEGAGVLAKRGLGVGGEGDVFADVAEGGGGKGTGGFAGVAGLERCHDVGAELGGGAEDEIVEEGGPHGNLGI